MAEPAKSETTAKPTPKYVTWIGEDDQWVTEVENEDGDLEKQEVAGPSFMFWARVRFDKGKAVLIDPEQAPSPDLKRVYEHILKKAPNMPTSFKVEDVDSKAGDDAGADSDEDGGDKHAKSKPRIQPVPKRRR